MPGPPSPLLRLRPDLLSLAPPGEAASVPEPDSEDSAVFEAFDSLFVGRRSNTVADPSRPTQPVPLLRQLSLFPSFAPGDTASVPEPDSEDSAIWESCESMEPPSTLSHKLSFGFEPWSLLSEPSAEPVTPEPEPFSDPVDPEPEPFDPEPEPRPEPAEPEPDPFDGLSPVAVEVESAVADELPAALAVCGLAVNSKGSTRVRQPAIVCSSPTARMHFTLLSLAITTKPKLPGRMRGWTVLLRNGLTLEWVTKTFVTFPNCE